MSITLHTASETFARQLKKKQIGPGSIFCVFASVARILIGKDDEYEKRICNICNQCARTFTEQLTSNTVSAQIFLALWTLNNKKIYFHTADVFAALVRASIWSRHCIIRYNWFSFVAYSYVIFSQIISVAEHSVHPCLLSKINIRENLPYIKY